MISIETFKVGDRVISKEWGAPGIVTALDDRGVIYVRLDSDTEGDATLMLDETDLSPYKPEISDLDYILTDEALLDPVLIRAAMDALSDRYVFRDDPHGDGEEIPVSITPKYQWTGE